MGDAMTSDDRKAALAKVHQSMHEEYHEMTREDIIRLAKEAGWKRVGRNHETGPEFPVLIERLERFAALVAVAKEQEMLAEGWVLDFPPPKEEADE